MVCVLINCLYCENVKDFNFKFQSPESLPPCGHFLDPKVGSQY